jgi:hypothetical protein
MNPVTAHKSASPGKGLLAGLMVAFLVAIVIATAWVFKTRVGFKAASGADSTYIEIVAAPWGTVKSVAAVDGSTSRFVNQQTPLRVAVPPGKYAIVTFAPDGHEYQQTILAGNGSPGRWHIVFGGFDPAVVASNADPELMRGIRAYYDGEYAAAEGALTAHVTRAGPGAGMATFFLGASRLSRFYLQSGKDEALLNAARDAFREAGKSEGFTPPEQYVSPKIVEVYKSVSR